MASTPDASRQRVRAALNFREPDRIPFDLGSSIETGLTVPAYDNFLKYMGWAEEPDVILPNLFVEAGGFKLVPDNILRLLKVDTRGTLIQYPSKPDPIIEFEGNTITAIDEWGIKWARPQTSLYMDPVDSPLRGKFTRQTFNDFQWPDPEEEGRFEGLAAEAQRLHDSGCAVMISLYGLGLFDMGEILCGMESLLTSMAMDPALVEDLYEHLLEFQIKQWEKMLEVVGPYIDVCLHSDDLGMQHATLMSPEMYRHYLKPRHKRLFDSIKKAAQGDVKVLLHSCGSIRAIIPDLIEIGVDALNPIQVCAAGMDTKELKREYGRELCFWGGGVDTQHVLPHGTPAQVKEEVQRRIDDLAPGGGFVFAAVHNIQPDVPPENLHAAWAALQEYGVY